jgi:chemotaxis protein histidine kinase CheA
MATISVGDLTPRNQYTATSGQTVFAYSFPIFVNTDLKVYNGSTLLTLTTHYTVSGAATDNGGNVTLGSGATAGDIITIYRDMPVARTSDYQTNGDLRAETLNDDLDKLAMMIQQIEFDLNNRVLRFGQFTTGIPLSEFTESATDRANKVLSFSSTGDPTITQELGEWTGNWAASRSYDVRDLVKDTSNNNVYICLTAHTSSGSQPISSNADVAKWALLIDSAAAATSATAAATSATAAASSATAAASSATAAATSKTGADTAKTAAETAKTAAETAETNAETAETNAETAETNAAASEAAALVSKNAAATSATAAASSATSATSSASTATTKASEASSSASTASGHKDTATTKASEAASSATGAASSATTATTQATNSASSATAAAASAAAAAASADNFDDVYLGGKSSDPTVDNDGDALTAGDM